MFVRRLVEDHLVADRLMVDCLMADRLVEDCLLAGRLVEDWADWFRCPSCSFPSCSYDELALIPTVTDFLIRTMFRAALDDLHTTLARSCKL